MSGNNSEKAENIDLSWHNLSVELVNKHHLLDECNGRAPHSKITAIFGMTGSGKTTLIKTLTGRLNKDLHKEGKIYIDDNIKKTSWTHTIAFVDDDFSLQKFQTVYETLFFAIKMLWTKDDESKVKTKSLGIIKMVGLTHNLNESVENLSQGEQKLLHIGIALAEEPSILILDDPFTSIDFYHMKKLLKLFRCLIDNNKSIIFTFSNPNDKFINYIDYLIILVNGTTIFEGTYEECEEHFRICGFENKKHCSLLEFVYDIISFGEDDRQRSVKSMQNARKLKDKWLETQRNSVKASSPIEVDEVPKDDYHKMTQILRRHFITIWRNKEFFWWLVIQKAFLFIAACLVYPRIGHKQEDIETRIGIVSFFILNATERAGTVTMGTFSEYRAVTIREIYCGIYSPTEAYWAKFLYNSSLGFVFSVVYIIPVYWLSNVNNNFWRFILFIINQFTLTNFIVAYAIVIGIYARDHLMAHIQGSLLFLLFIIFSGIFVNIGTIGPYIRWVTWISPMYYAYESNLQVSMSNLTFECGKETCYNTGKEVLDNLNIGKIHYFPALVIQWLFIFLFVIIGWYSFLRKYKPKLSIELNNLTDRSI